MAAAARARAPHAQSRTWQGTALTLSLPDLPKTTTCPRTPGRSPGAHGDYNMLATSTENDGAATSNLQSTAKLSTGHLGKGVHNTLMNQKHQQPVVRCIQRDQTALARAAARRAVHWPPGARDKPGHAVNSASARLIVHRYTLCCKRCGALVDMRSAKVEATLRDHGPRRALRAAGFRLGAASFAPGDGCASASCSSSHRLPIFTERQQMMAQQLLGRERVLLAWPRDTQDTVFWRQPSAEVGAAVLNAFAVCLGEAKGQCMA